MKQKQANARTCFVCGVENPVGLKMHFYLTGPGQTLAEYTVPAHYQGYPGIVHGGIIASMLDEVAGRVVMNGDPPRFMVTANLSVRYRRPVPTGKPLRLVGTLKEDQGRVAKSTAVIYDESGTLLAEAEAVLVEMPTDSMARFSDDPSNWQVYPD